MTLSNYLSFFILVFTIVYSPAPMTMFLMANGMKTPSRHIWPILMGANNAYLLSIFIFTIGLTQLLQQNIYVMKTVQVGGILYLLYLAYTQWNKTIVPGTTPAALVIPENTTSLYAKGALIALSICKTILLFGVVFPQFISDGEQRALQIAVFGTTFLVLQFTSGWVYVYFGRRIKTLVEKPHCQQLMNKNPAVVLFVIALFLLIRL